MLPVLRALDCKEVKLMYDIQNSNAELAIASEAGIDEIFGVRSSSVTIFIPHLYDDSGKSGPRI